MEKHDEQKFMRWCEEHNYLCLKLQLANKRGWPDRTIITPDRVIFMEFKTPVGVLSPHQKHWIKKLRGYGSVQVYVPRSCEEAIGFVTGRLKAQKLD